MTVSKDKVTQDIQQNCFLRIEGVNGSRGDGGKGFIRTNRDIGTTLHFSNMPPELGTTKSAMVNPYNILGRSNPIYTYAYSDERAWNLELKFAATSDVKDLNNLNSSRLTQAVGQGRVIDIVESSIRREVLDKVNWCESLIYPISINKLSHGIPILAFVFGRWLNVKVICTDVTTSLPGPYSVLGAEVGYPMLAIVNLTLKQLGQRAFSMLDVQANLHNSTGRDTS